MSTPDVLRHLLILQHKAVETLVTEYHQQTEAYVQQFNLLPLSREDAESAHDARITLRSTSSSAPSLTECCAVSTVIQEATKKYCDREMRATSPEDLESLVDIAKNDVKIAEERIHLLFALDASLEGKKDMQSKFERKQGYDLLIQWLAISCSYQDEMSKNSTDLVLRVLKRNMPTMSFTIKTVIKDLSKYKKVMKGQKKNKELLSDVINQMEGYLDHLETTGPIGLHKIWARRFFKLNSTFHVLEFFTDETQCERKGKLEMHGAVVSTADELGGLLSDDKGAVEMSRRFIFRLTENGSKKHHYLCANLSGVKAPESPTYKLASSTRDYLEEWIRALRAVIASGEDARGSMSLGELNAQIGAFMNHMHLSAHISNRVRDHRQSTYEITVKAWILERELAMVDEEQDAYSHGSIGSGDMSWQILEYSCAWRVPKTTAELRNFDGQLRLLFGPSMHNVAFPSSTIGNKLHHLHLHASASQKEVENQERKENYDAYLQSLLHMPEFSSFGSDASTMLDTFLDISPHLTSFRKLEKEIGQSMHLRDRKVVPWKDRKRFEVVYKTHLQVIAAQEEHARRVQTVQAVSPKKAPRSKDQHRHSRHHYHEMRDDTADTEKKELCKLTPVPVDAYVVPIPTSAKLTASAEVSVPAPVKLTAPAEEPRPGEAVREAVRERIARIGHQLVIEAFDV
ncbi:hypothetical protein P3T76_009234 [Phytophthora citrophthora]|uniref:PH domain-containing protein n=1 Tax=Phytophthora citrophthora TaxID=4793 RepID=A0AAD9GGI2_9STRA|nr:hypothetical protein P3T76_009234 [Phytophthora citrophthora]